MPTVEIPEAPTTLSEPTVNSLAERLADKIVNALRIEALAGDDLIVDTRQAARICGVSPRTLEAMRSDGQGPECIRLSGVSVGYRMGSLRDWIKSRPRYGYRALAPAIGGGASLISEAALVK